MKVYNISIARILIKVYNIFCMAIIKCSICGRPLESNESISRGIGSKCAAKYANGIQAAGASLTTVEALETSNDSYVVERIRRAKLAIGKGRIRDARLFLELAAERVALPLAA
jgi:hypothetical protein